VNNRLHIIADDDNNKPIFSGTETLVGTWMDVPKPLVRVYTEAEYPPQQATPFHRDDAITNSDSTVGVWKLSPITYRHPQVIYVENAGTENETRTVLKQVGWSSPLGTWIYQNFGSDANPIWNPAELRGLILTDMVDWTFFWASNALYIRVPSSKPSPNDPSVRIEASRYHPLDAVVVDYLHLKGITFRHSSTINDDGFDGLAGVALGFGCLIEDCNVEWMDSEGLNIRVNGEIRNCTVAFNGRTGLGANGSLNGPFTLTNTLVISNNWRGFEVCHHCGGAKIIADSDYGGSVIVDNRFIGNNGPGLWLDSVRNNSSPVIVSNNLSAFNMPSGPFARTSYFVPYSTNGVTYTISHCGAGGGFLLEFGARIHAINNIVATNAGYGIGLASTKDSKVLHNTVVTGAEGVAFYMVAEPGRWACTGNDIRNNIFLQNYADIYFPGEAFPGMSVEGGSIDGLNGGAYVNVVALSLLDYNCYYATVSGSPAEFRVGYKENNGDTNATFQQRIPFASYLAQVSQGNELWDRNSFVGSPGLLSGYGPSHFSLVTDRGADLSSIVAFDRAGVHRGPGPDIGAYEFILMDSDGDGFDDNWELAYGFNHLAANDPPSGADPDGDGLSNLLEYQRVTNPLVAGNGAILYVNATNGSPAYTGLFPTSIPPSHGPKPTINAALLCALVIPGGAGFRDEIRVAAGNYNETADLRTRSVTLRVPSGTVNLRAP